MLLQKIPTLSKKISTIIGISAVFFWGMNVGLIRNVSINFGALGGATLIYTISTFFLFFTIGLPKFQQINKKYLIIGGLIFVACELCFSLSIGYSQNNQQAIEVGMINYMWPALTLIFSIIFTNIKANILIFPGCILAIIGIIRVLGGDNGFDIKLIYQHLLDNPISYSLAFGSALLWAIYCVVTVKMSNGQNLITIFFTLCSITLWIKYLYIGNHTIYITSDNIMSLIYASGALGLGYAAWNLGIVSGNVTVLAGSSYFTPVLSTFFASLLLNTDLSFIFWQGVILVTFGAILCWLATKNSTT